MNSIHASWFRRVLPWLMLVASALRAQVLDDAVFTLGTTTRDASNRDWAYIVVQPTQPDLLGRRKLSVNFKAGDADAAAGYERRAVLTLQTDPLAIRALLSRAANVGDDLSALGERIDNLFAAVIPAPGLPLEDKISAAIRGSLSKPEQFANLIQLGRLHPAIEMALGLAHAELIPPGVSTVEVREFDLALNADRGVLGRVTVTAGSPVVLPRPGAPFEVADASGRGHLNVKLRWSTSPEFRRLSLLSYGFDLVRMRRTFAEAPANNFAAVPPTPAQLRNLLLTQGVNVQRVNPLPILTRGNLDESPAAQPNSVFNASNRVAFISDDNGLARGGTAFENGDQFYYFVAGRDLLGRNGLVSTGSLVTICDRIPPNAPGLPRVENDYHFVGGVVRHRLRVSWQRVVPEPGERITGYYVYRWRSPTEATRNESNPVLNRISPLIPATNGVTTYSFLDEGPGAPSAAADLDTTYWYTVRSADASACGGNVSANSPAAFGVLRDRVAPAGPQGGGVATVCCDVLVDKGEVSDRRPADGNANQQTAPFTFDLACDRADAGIAWAEFWMATEPDVEQGQLLTDAYYRGRVPFQPGQDRTVQRIEIPQRLLLNQVDGQVVACRVGDLRGNVSTIAITQTTRVPLPGGVRTISFVARSRCRYVFPLARPGAADRDCDHHTTRPPGSTTNQPPVVVIPLTPTTKEFRLYRRVDFGPLQLIKQGPANYDSVTNVAVEIPDNDLPASSAVICYYAQLFDQNGNGSPLTQLGECKNIETDTAQPMLAPLEPVGDEDAPQMRIRWFCAPAGIRRFQVCVATIGNDAPTTLSPELSTNIAPVLNYEPIFPLSTNIFLSLLTPTWGCYLTPQIGPNFGTGAAFDITVPIQTGRRYYVRIRTVDASGAVLKTSNTESLLWSAVTQVGPLVPWPARSLPPTNFFNTNLVAVRVRTNDFNGLGVVIGGGLYFGPRPVSVVGDNAIVGVRQEVVFNGAVDPKIYLYTNRLGESILPVVMYRYQVPTAFFPKVSGDIVQVTPLMERIVSLTTNAPNGTVFTRVYDPFVYVSPPTTVTDLVGFYLVVLKDTQPAVVGAAYRYILVRFDAAGEIAEVVPVPNTVNADL
jgi:hypothetical protein